MFCGTNKRIKIVHNTYINHNRRINSDELLLSNLIPEKFGQKFLEAQIKNAASYLDREFSCVTA